MLLNIKASSTYMRPKRQMWSVDHPAIVLYRQHPSAMRKFYWYNTRAPILVGKMRLKNYMRNMHMLPRYVHSPAQYHEAYSNSKRSVFRDLNNVHGFKTTSTTPAPTVGYVAAPINTIEYSTGPVNPPVDFNLAPVNSFVPLTAGTLSNAERVMGVSNQWNRSDYSHDVWQKCTENCFKNSFQDYAKDQYSSHSMPKELPVTTTTTLPYFNYVAHTYFTLDDVILPHSASKIAKSPTLHQHEFRPSHHVLTTVIPQDVFTERFKHTTQPIPTTTTTTTTEPSLPAKTTFLDFEYSTTPHWISSTTSITTTSSTESTLLENTLSWTTPQTIINNYSKTNVTTQSFKHRLKSLKATKDFSSNIETKLKLLKLHLKNLVTTKETPRNIQNLTTSAVTDSNTTLPDSTTTPTPVTRRTTVNRKFRKLRVPASTKKVPIQISRNSTNPINAKKEYKKSKRIYQRRKHLNSTVSPEPTKNTTTIDNESINKFKRRATASTRKSINADEKVIVGNSTKATSRGVAKSRADGIPEEKSALVTESAIMTISSGNMRTRQPIIKVKPKQHITRKIKHLENDNFIPSLPIEVYFKKVNQQ
ncbi:mucin-5AC [Drosophila elegans]|uniref:mucin-5AC n=1 Tax=Drosophila elegans TaxID=30023 RepID=UPI001BC85806|nr:mucin-5AC [Drosophila elegans]